jgi:hypothetical protein
VECGMVKRYTFEFSVVDRGRKAQWCLQGKSG